MRLSRFRNFGYKFSLLFLFLSISLTLAVFKKTPLLDSLKWQVIWWREKGLSQADVARSLNVSHSVIQRLWDQYQSQDSECKKHVLSWTRIATPTDDLFRDYFVPSGSISVTMVWMRFHKQVCARWPVAILLKFLIYSDWR